MKKEFPRLVIAGTKGDSGKTIVSLGLLLALREKGFSPVAFKKGPDYIDAAWLGWASKGVGRNLDLFMMKPERILQSFLQHAGPDQINIIEGNRGLHDGSDINGTHSTAELAKLLQAPTVLVIPITKMTRTAAAVVKGCVELDPGVNIAGVILNDCAGERHIRVAKQSIETLVGVPVIGAIPKLLRDPIPNRHLGLTTVSEYEGIKEVSKELCRIILDSVDLEKIKEIAQGAKPLPQNEKPLEIKEKRNGLKIGVISDRAFSFYYPENIEGLIQAGCEVVNLSAFETKNLPDDLSALVIGGGFPEVYLEKLSGNRSLMVDIKKAAKQGLPIYAECGGLMYLAKSVEYNGETFSLCDVFPIELSVSKKPQGHGYCEAVVDGENPFFKNGTLLRGHEFHYSYIVSGADVNTTFKVTRGKGSFDKRDGLNYKNVLAGFLHLHAIGTPELVKGIVGAASKYGNCKSEQTKSVSGFGKTTVSCC